MSFNILNIYWVFMFVSYIGILTNVRRFKPGKGDVKYLKGTATGKFHTVYYLIVDACSYKLAPFVMSVYF